jgi:tetratricopeptide (TPR) repeat protein
VALRGRRPRRRLSPWILLAGLGAGVGLVGTPLGPWLAARFDPADPSFAWRRQMLGMAWDMVRDHPWLGVGPGAFPVTANLYQRLPYVGGQNPHNIFLEWAAELGLPTALLGCAGLVALLIRPCRGRPPLSAGDRHRLAILTGTLVAFAGHAALDIDWSYPAIGLLAAVTLGLTVAALPQPCRLPPLRQAGPWLLLVGLLVGAGLLAGGRYGAGLFVARAEDQARLGDLPGAQASLTWALRLNPTSFSAHQLLAQTALRRGNPSPALQAAEALASLNPDDPNSLALAGEVAGAVGRWSAAEAWFRRAVDLAPAAQLRLHVGLVESALQADHAAEAQLAFTRLLERFPPDRVLAEDARCLAPGDRYLLARAARRLLSLAEGGAGPIPPEDLQETADRLGQPDPRPICGAKGRPGQTSPEATVQGFWEAVRSGEQAAADRLLASPLAGRPLLTDGPRSPAGIRMVAIRQLDAGEDRAALHYVLRGELPDGRMAEWCAATHLRRESVGWIIDRPTTLLSACTR